jgi:hypothetical protein
MQQVHRWFLSAVQQQCRQHLDAFREQRGEEVFAHRSRHRTPISGSIKVRAWGRWVGVAPAGMERGGGAGSFEPGMLRSVGGNLMPSNSNVGLNRKQPMNHVRVTALLDQLQG